MNPLPPPPTHTQTFQNFAVLQFGSKWTDFMWKINKKKSHIISVKKNKKQIRQHDLASDPTTTSILDQAPINWWDQGGDVWLMCSVPDLGKTKHHEHTIPTNVVMEGWWVGLVLQPEDLGKLAVIKTPLSSILYQKLIPCGQKLKLGWNWVTQ